VIGVHRPCGGGYTTYRAAMMLGYKVRGKVQISNERWTWDVNIRLTRLPADCRTVYVLRSVVHTYSLTEITLHGNWTTHGHANSRSRRCRQKNEKLSMQSCRRHPRIIQSASRQSASWRIHELSSNLDHVGYGLNWAIRLVANKLARIWLQSHSTQNKSFRWRSSQAVSWSVLKKLKLT